MKKCNIFITLVIIAALLCTLPALVTRINAERHHRAYAVGLVLTADMTDSQLAQYLQNGTDTLVADEEDGSFDAKRIGRCREMGFDIAIRVYAGEKKSESYETELNSIVKENGVKYLIVKKDKDTNKFAAPIENVIKDNGMTLIVSENMSQLSNEMPEGYEDYLNAADGRVMRSYETLKNPLRTLSSGAEGQDAGELLYHHMINSARDRNTEFIVLNQIDDGSGDTAEATRQTCTAAAKFEKWMQKLGYTEHGQTDLSSYENHSRTASGGAAMLGMMMVLIAGEIIFKKRNAALEYAAIGTSVLFLAVTYVLPQALLLLYPTLFAPVAACFSFTVCIYAADKAKTSCSFAKTLVITLLTALITLAVSASVLGALLATADYYLNNDIFRGVKLTLMLPVVYSAAAMWIYNGCTLNIKENIKKIKPWHIILTLAVCAAAGIYVMRSGNAKISPLENQIRNLIAEVTTARPRTKEFLIGWPMLALAVYYIKHPVSVPLRLLTSVGSSILFASIINTFCHVFTDFSVSALRTFNGFVFSLPFAAVILAFNVLILRWFRLRSN